HSPIACSLLAFGIDSRKTALRLAEICPDESMNSLDTLIWFIGLTQQELTDLGFPHDEIMAILEAQKEVQRITWMTPRHRESWTFSVKVECQRLVELQEGD